MKYKYYLKYNTHLSLARFSAQIYIPSFIGIADEEIESDVDSFYDYEFEKRENSWINLNEFYKVPEDVNLIDYLTGWRTTD